ncbi:MAG: FtsB family cell division protein [Haliscomenobacter sp.]
MKRLFQPLLQWAPPALRNRYMLVLLLFVFWMLFMDKHDVLTQWRLQRTLNKLEREKEYYFQRIERAERDRLNLEANGEKFARERYFMKKPGEDVFIIEEKD